MISSQYPLFSLTHSALLKQLNVLYEDNKAVPLRAALPIINED